MTTGKKILFIDRDGTLVKEAPPTYQIDSFTKLEFYPDMFYWMRKIATELDFELVMITNQDGLGTSSFPEEDFLPVHNFIMTALENEQIHFNRVLIDRTYPSDQAPTRKPGTGLLTDYLSDKAFDIPGSFVIGDRITDVQLAKNLGCRAFWLNNDPALGGAEVKDDRAELDKVVALETPHWKEIYEYLRMGQRSVTHQRDTNETKIHVTLDLDGSGKTAIRTGISFFDHMLEQLGKHSNIDLSIEAKGDLHIDEHHTIEDTAIALGETINRALGDKKGIDRYGFALPMDDCLAQVALDFGGRPWLVWNVDFKREKIGDMPTEMFFHFFKSFSDAARCNLHITAGGENEHHKIESIFKALAKCLKMAIKRDVNNMQLPSTKGIL